jgi:glutathione S-transferase
MSLRLIIGNKAYSSWSLRPWLALTHLGIPFEEELVPLFLPGSKERITSVSDAGKVPVLIDGDITIWESLSILEYINETYAQNRFWPEDREARAHARSIANEMHAGFGPLRSALPMNVRRPVRPLPLDAAVAANSARIQHLWRQARRNWGQDGPFLYGAFSAADAMYAPVVLRFHHYAVPVWPELQPYMDAIRALPALQSWVAAGTAEPWIIDEDEK